MLNAVLWSNCLAFRKGAGRGSRGGVIPDLIGETTIQMPRTDADVRSDLLTGDRLHIVPMNKPAALRTSLRVSGAGDKTTLQCSLQMAQCLLLENKPLLEHSSNTLVELLQFLLRQSLACEDHDRNIGQMGRRLHCCDHRSVHSGIIVEEHAVIR